MNHRENTLIVLLVLFFISVFATSCLSGFNVKSISGVITDSESGTPLEDVEVNIRWESDSTDVGIKNKYDTTASDGYYQFQDLPANIFEITAVKSSYDTTTKNIEMGRGIRLNFTMEKSEN